MTGVRLEMAFLTLAGVDDAALDRWLAFAVPVVAGAQRAAGTAAYAVGRLSARLAGATQGTLPVMVDVIDAIRPVSAAEVYARPIVTARWALSQGHDFQAAMQTGAHNAAAL